MSNRSVITLVLLTSALIPGLIRAAEQQGVVAESSGVWINGRYFGHNPGSGGLAGGLRPAETTQAPAGRIDAEADRVSYDEYTAEPAGCCDLGYACGDSVGCCDLVCGPCGRNVYGAVEYVYGWTKGSEAPALVTTSDDATVQDDAGVLGLSTTTVLLGNEDLNNGGRSGGRITLGMGLDPCRNRRVEFVYSFLDSADEAFATSSDEFAILARPFFNSDSGEQDALLIGFDGLASGDLSVQSSSEFRSYELQLRQDACCWRGGNVELLIGYRAAELDDDIAINQTALALSGPTAGSTTDLTDQFSTSNLFHGGQVGLDYQLAKGRRWSCGCTVKTALGSTRQKARIAGSTTVTTAASAVSTTSGGLLTQGTNIGEYSQNEFSTISEVGLNVRYKLKKSVELTFGYNVMFWSDVLRAAEQIDTAVNPTQIPPGTLTGDARPEFTFDTTSFWAQGVRAGIESRF